MKDQCWVTKETGSEVHSNRLNEKTRETERQRHGVRHRAMRDIPKETETARVTETRMENLERRRCPARGSGTCRQTLGGRRCGQRAPRCGPVEEQGPTLRGRKPSRRATGSADKAAQRRHPPASPGRRAGSRSGGLNGVAGAGRRPRAETARASNRGWGAG